MNIIIRPIEEKDKEQLERLYTQTIQEDFPEYGSKTIEYFSNGKYKEDMLHMPLMLGAFLDEKLIGFVLCEKPFGGILFVTWLATDKKYRGQGIGRRLLEEVRKIALETGVHALHLMSDTINVPFYEKCGYEVYGIDPDGYFGSRDYLLRKKVQEPSEEKFL